MEKFNIKNNKEMNLCEILKGHEGETFYSPVFGIAILKEISNDYLHIKSVDKVINLYKDGKYDIYGECILFPSKDQRDWNKWDKENKKIFDGRHFSNEAINWKDIKVGDVVLEGDTNFNYRTITNITGNNWEYVDDTGYYHETKPDYCHWKVCGQKGCNGKLIKISIGEGQKPKVPKTWSELEKTINPFSPDLYTIDTLEENANFPIEKSALALLKIYQLIEVGYGGNISSEEWNNNKWKFTYQYTKTGIDIIYTRISKYIIAFHTKEQAEEFLSYPENIQLLKDYFMLPVTVQG